MEEDVIKKEENLKHKKSHKKIIIIVLIILFLIIIGISIGVFYYLKTEENKISELNKKQEQAFLETEYEIKYGDEISYQDLLNKLLDVSKVQNNTKITIKINDKDLSEEEKYTFNEIGTFNIKVLLEYNYNYSIIKSISKLIENEKNIEIKIEDTEKPVITGISNREITVGDEINLLDGITATDNIDEEVEITTEGSVDNTKAGEYVIKVIAKDKSGNIEEQTFTVTVKEKEEEVVIPSTNNGSNKSNVTQTGKKKVKTEKQEELTKSETKYGVAINTYKITTYAVYNDGSKSVEKQSSETRYDKSNYSATTSEILPEARSVRNSNANLTNEVLNYTNSYRQEVGVQNLQLDENLTVAAYVRAIEIAYSGKFSHTRPNGTSCFTIFDDMNIFSFASGENIAYGQNSAKGAAETWKKSPGHYQNMINSSFSKIGIGVFKLQGTYYWVQIFSN